MSILSNILSYFSDVMASPSDKECYLFLLGDVECPEELIM